MAVGLVARDPTGFKPHPDLWSVGAYAQLILGGGTPFASGSNPTAEDLKATGVSLGRSYRATPLVSAGTITIIEAGDYEVEINLFDHSEGSASGNVEFDIVYAPDGVTFAAFAATDATGGGGRMQALSLALTTKERLVCKKIQKLFAGSKIKAQVTSAAGGVCTVTDGILSVTKLADTSPPSAP